MALLCLGDSNSSEDAIERALEVLTARRGLHRQFALDWCQLTLYHPQTSPRVRELAIGTLFRCGRMGDHERAIHEDFADAHQGNLLLKMGEVFATARVKDATEWAIRTVPDLSAEKDEKEKLELARRRARAFAYALDAKLTFSPTEQQQLEERTALVDAIIYHAYCRTPEAFRSHADSRSLVESYENESRRGRPGPLRIGARRAARTLGLDDKRADNLGRRLNDKYGDWYRETAAGLGFKKIEPVKRRNPRKRSGSPPFRTKDPRK